MNYNHCSRCGADNAMNKFRCINCGAVVCEHCGSTSGYQDLENLKKEIKERNGQGSSSGSYDHSQCPECGGYDTLRALR